MGGGVDLPVVVEAGRVRAPLEQQAADARALPLHGAHQRRLAVGVGRVHVRAVVQQQQTHLRGQRSAGGTLSSAGE